MRKGRSEGAGRKAAKGRTPGSARAAAAPRDGDGELRATLEQLALLTAVNNLMAQTAFLSLERLRISSEVVDENVSDAFGTQLYGQCERLVGASDDLILQLLDGLGIEGPRADLVRDLVALRRQFKDRTRKPMEQRRLVESLERMYR